MVKSIYLAAANINDDASGVTKKIISQCESFKRNNADIDIVSSYTPKNAMDCVKRFLPIYNREAIKDIFNKISNMDLQEYEFVYIRYMFAGKDILKVLKLIREKNRSIKIICEFPTYPYRYELKKIQFIPWLIRDKLYFKKFMNYIDLCTTYSETSCIEGKKCLELFNGIDATNYKIRSYIPHEGTFNVIGVGQLSQWHGYERLIRGLKEYYLQGGKERIVFHVVGNGSQKAALENTIRQNNMEKHVKMYGFLGSQDLQKLYNISDLAVGSLNTRMVPSMHMSPLKTKEYCAVGVPFIHTTKDYLFMENDFKYSMVCEDDGSNIDIEKILSFSRDLHKMSTPQQISEEMHNFALNSLGWDKNIQYILQEIEFL